GVRSRWRRRDRGSSTAQPPPRAGRSRRPARARSPRGRDSPSPSRARRAEAPPARSPAAAAAESFRYAGHGFSAAWSDMIAYARLAMPRIGVISDTHGLVRPEALRPLACTGLIVPATDVGARAERAARRPAVPVVA